jgi:RNA polymerase sigma-70 factor, ECF subfamily
MSQPGPFGALSGCEVIVGSHRSEATLIEPDEQLVRRVRSGDREAFSVLVQRYERPVQAVACSVLRNWHDANDVSQQAFVAAYEKLNRLWFARKFGSWLLCITHRLAVRHVQRRKRRSLSELDPNTAAPGIRPELSDLSLDLVSLLGRLPVQERVVVSLRHLDGLSLAEVAQATGRPVGTVSKQLSRAYSRLRGWLDGEVTHG